MSITLEDNAKNAMLVALGALLSGGVLELQDAEAAEVATLGLSDDAGNALNTPEAGSATFKSISSDTDITGGTIAGFVMKTSLEAAVYSGTVTATGGGGDLTMAVLEVLAGGTISANTITVSI